MGNFIVNIRTRVWWKNALSLLFAILLISNAVVIFMLSSENATDSTNRSEGAADIIAGVVVDGYHDMSEVQQEAEISKLHVPLRTLAHFSLFASLGAIATLLVYSLGLKKWYFTILTPLAFGLLYAIFDELHQQFSADRVSDIADVLVDFAGTFSAVAIVNIVALVVLYVAKRKGEES